jgi:hypothetical protein
MKSVVITFVALTFLISAHADFIKPATLDVTCRPQLGGQRLIRITSDSRGSSLIVNDIKVLEGPRLVGGTEGGEPYLQILGSGYNITISGGDFQKSFYASSSIVDGEAMAHVMDLNLVEQYNVTCRGLYSFEKELID